MRRLLFTLVVGIAVLAVGNLQAEEKAPAFPASWEGAWAGPCVVVRQGKTVMSFPMELHVKKLEEGDGWTWRIVYGEGDKRQVRPYELLPVEKEPDHFIVDEKNGILIDHYLENDTLHARFAVMSSVIEATYEKKGEDEMRVTLTTFGHEPKTKSGAQGNIPEVHSFPLLAVQRAALERSPDR